MKKPRSESRQMHKSVTIRVSDDLMHAVEHAAKLSKLTPSSWARVALSEAAGLGTDKIPLRKPRKKAKPLDIAESALKIADAAITLGMLNSHVQEMKDIIEEMNQKGLVNRHQINLLEQPYAGVIKLVADVNAILFSKEENTNDT